MTPTGPQVMRGGKTDMRAMKNEWHLVGIHEGLGKLFSHHSTPISPSQWTSWKTQGFWRTTTRHRRSLPKPQQKRPEQNLGRTSMEWGGKVQSKANCSSSDNSSSHSRADTATTCHTSSASTGQNHPICAANFASHKRNWQAST